MPSAWAVVPMDPRVSVHFAEPANSLVGDLDKFDLL